jgi:hypothetical protein
MEWSRAYEGLQHLGEISETAVRVSVEDFTGAACLKIFFPNSPAFSPERKWFTGTACVERAKRAGERVMRRVTA